MKNILKVFLSFIFLASFIFIPFHTLATTGNVSGWAISDNIGWISFNSSTGGGATNYGVNIETAVGNISNVTGMAWSDNIGWIDFNPAGPFPSIGPNHSAQINISNAEFSGWARALAHGGGWDGWISMRGTTPDYGVWLDIVPNPNELRGFAWGGDVMGWITFNDKEPAPAGPIDHQVTTTFDLNSPPIASLPISTVRYCDHDKTPQVATGLTISLGWSYSDADGDLQQTYEIQVSTSNTFPSTGRFDRIVTGVGTAHSLDSTIWLNPLNWNSTFHWRVRVNDGNHWSDWASSQFSITRNHPSPNITFTFPEHISINELITFDGTTSQVYDGINTPVYHWTFQNANPLTATTSIAETTFSQINPTTAITFRVTDASNYSCTREELLNIKPPLPDWEEITPFGRVRNFIASIIKIISDEVFAII